MHHFRPVCSVLIYPLEPYIFAVYCGALLCDNFMQKKQ